MVSASQSAPADLLTRTTLRLGGDSPLAIEQVIRALQRVPGVLTVEADARGASALVAHDSAVPLTSLVAAASSAGVAARLGGEMRGLPTAVAATLLPNSIDQAPHLRFVAVALILAVIVVDTAFPNSPEKRWLLLVPIAVLWAFVVFRAAAVRRR